MTDHSHSRSHSTADDGAKILPSPDRLQSELAETTLELVAFDTANPPGETRAIVDWFESELAGLGLETDRFAVDPDKPNLLAWLSGTSERSLCFSGHLDTVPYDPDGWSRDPLGERVDDRLYGRGATDMKGAIAAMVTVARGFAESGIRPPVALMFAFVSDEEIAGDAGTKALLEANRLEVDACLIGEPTSTGSDHSITVADRGSIWLTVPIFSSKQQHLSQRESNCVSLGLTQNVCCHCFSSLSK